MIDIEGHTNAPAGSSDRAFGLVFAAVFALVGGYPWLRGAAAHGWAFALAVAFLAVALVRPRLLAPLNRGWTRLGQLLHRLASPVALFVVYALAVVPTGLVRRAFGKDPLRLRRDPAANTYWIERSPPARADGRMKKQF
jgi:hypothetical protein